MNDVTHDEALRALLSHDEPPQRDPSFTYAVMHRLAARRAIYDIVGLGVSAFAAGAVLWAVLPLATPLLAGTSEVAASPWIIPIVIVISLVWPVGFIRLPRRMTET